MSLTPVAWAAFMGLFCAPRVMHGRNEMGVHSIHRTTRLRCVRHPPNYTSTSCLQVAYLFFNDFLGLISVYVLLAFQLVFLAGTIFFSHNKLVNSIFSHNFLVKWTGSTFSITHARPERKKNHIYVVLLSIAIIVDILPLPKYLSLSLSKKKLWQNIY
jgi:hypothetical protein